MKRVHKLEKYPNNTLIASHMESIDYFDSYMIEKETDESVDQIVKKILALPVWVEFLLNIRYFLLVKPFGLRTGVMTDKQTKSNDEPVPVINRNENEIVMGEDDRHLYYGISVMKLKKAALSEITLTTVVKFHNQWGRIYFAFIKPFHKLVVRSMLSKI